MSHFSMLMLVLFYRSCFIHLSHSLNNGLSVELIHRDSSKSPIYQPTETKFQRVYNAVHGSINRANHFTKQLSLNTNNPVSMVTPDAGEYFISYSVGTPSFKAYGFMDTGSSLIWLQCQPCTTCFNQTSPIFNPSKSSSYKNIRCSSKTCTHAEDMHTSCSYSDNDCEYSIIYDDNFKSQGDLSLETLTLDFYSSLESTVVKVVKLPRVELPGYQFRLCYNTSTLVQSNIFPIITVHFSGGDVKVNYNSTFIPVKKGIMCFTFLPFQGPVIFGSLAQHNLLVGYDLNKSIISFKSIDCTKY
jgi:hypothetical protein